MTFECNVCGKKFTLRHNRNKHRRIFHPEEAGVPVYSCQKCDFTTYSYYGLECHFRIDHLEVLHHLCHYCYIGYENADEYINHLEHHHGLPAWSTIAKPSPPTEEAFNGKLAIYQMTVEEHGLPDLFNAMVETKSQIKQLVRDRVRNEPQKVQFTALVELSKPALNDKEEEKTLEVHINSQVEIAYIVRISDETFFEMLETMMNVLTTFSAEGSG